jgi:hypothetical protein
LPFDRERFKDRMRQMLAMAWSTHRGEETPYRVCAAGDKRPHAQKA